MRHSITHEKFSYKCGINLSATKQSSRERLNLHDGRTIEGNKLRQLKHRIAKFKLTLKDWADMYENQDGRCDICEKAETRAIHGGVCELSIDHCHKTGKIRALLCHTCNEAIGRFKDDPHLVWRGLEYLVKHGARV